MSAMATLTIRQLDDGVYDRLRARAKAHNRSIEAEARQMLGERLSSRVAWVEELTARHHEMVAKYGYLPDSTELIRRMRDEE